MKKYLSIFLLFLYLCCSSIPVFSEEQVDDNYITMPEQEEYIINPFDSMKLQGGVIFNTGKKAKKEPKQTNIWRELGERVTVAGYSYNENGDKKDIIVLKDYYKTNNNKAKIIEGIGLFALMQLAIFGVVNGSRTQMYSGIKIKF